MAESVITDLQLRAYFAAVIGQTRFPFGKRSAARLINGQSQVLAQNATRDKVLSVVVGRSDIVSGGTVTVIFSQSNAASANDFNASFTPTSNFVFTLMPEDSLTITVIAGGTAAFSVGQETY